MADPSISPTPELDIREQIARIDLALAQHAAAQATAEESRQLLPGRLALVEADIARRRQEVRWQPWLAMFSGLTAGAALLAAGFALAKLFGH